jgi:DNA-binding transcriptional MerR regulator
MAFATAPDRAQFRTSEVLEILGLTRRQLQYWAQTDLIAPSDRTPGGHGRYSFEDLVALKAAKRLLDAGVSLQRIRSSIGALRELLPSLHQPLAEVVLVATGDVVLALDGGAPFDVATGQEWIFEVADFQSQVDAWRRSVEGLPARPRPRPVRRSRSRTRSA